ncbi:RNA polymerase sigma factor [Cryptosporangium sp. NPDC048952]|uniref:RNA polymerase sigma factor n=1 Tax=Cryptosporangium sp. NPDC048952 TaxID=3363961 RepID=UPI0037241CE3
MASDTELLRSIATGDATALSLLYERHSRALYGYLLRLAGDRMVAEEILQDTMLAVWRSAGAFEGRAQVTTWLFGIARRQAHNRLRLRSGPPPAETIDRPDGSAGPEELAIAAAGGTPVAAAVDRLPAHHRDVIALVFVAGLPLADVAEVLAIPVGTVKSRLFHARAAVAAALAAQEVPE